MNDAHRNALQRHLRQLASDIILTDDLIGALFQQRVFERNMIELIKSERTESDQVYKLLELLPKRGPDAFHNFVNIIENDYPWLAAMLLSSQKEEPTRTNRIDSYKAETETPKVSMIEIPEPEMDIKQRVSTFVHKQFGQSKRISENDKKGMVKWFSQQLQLERKRVCMSATSERSETMPVISTMVDASCGTDENDVEHPNAILNKCAQKVLDKLEGIKLESKPRNVNCKLESAMSNASIDSRKELITPNSLEMVFEELDFLVNRIENLESEINKCHVMLGDKDKKMSLSLLIYNINLKNKEYLKDISQEKQKSEKMLNEIYDYSTKIKKFDQLRSQQKALLDQQATEIEKVKEENEKLKTQVQQLEKLLSLHTEKQKTLENLRNMVKELQQDKMSDISSVRNVSTRASERRGSFSKRFTKPGVQYASKTFRPSGTETPQNMFSSRKYAVTRSPVKRNRPGGYNPNTSSNKY